MRLLVTRPVPENERTALALRELGHEPMLVPVLRIETVAQPELGAPRWTAILLTSVNAARAIAEHPRFRELSTLPVLAVGQASAQAARAAGFKEVTPANGDVNDLGRLAAERFPGVTAPLLYLAGEDRAGDVGGLLSAQGIPVRTAVVYRAIKGAQWPPEVRASLERGEIEGVLHFSKRSTEAYLACSGDMLLTALRPIHYCISARAAEPLREARASRIRVAAGPDEAGLFDLIKADQTPK
jgi:uroporphyrinogen-III synthase